MDKGKVPALVLQFGASKEKPKEDDHDEALLDIAKEIRSAKSDKAFCTALAAFVDKCRG